MGRKIRVVSKLALASLFLGCLAGIPGTSATAISCNSGPFIIFFDADSAELDSQDMEILERVVEISASPCFTDSQLMLAGHADVFSDAHHRNVSKQRNKSVFRYLFQRGIKKSLIMSKAFGATNPLIAALEGVAEAQNRRVEIFFGPAKASNKR